MLPAPRLRRSDPTGPTSRILLALRISCAVSSDSTGAGVPVRQHNHVMRRLKPTAPESEGTVGTRYTETYEMSSRQISLALLTGIALVGCEGATPDVGAEVARRDSAGVAISEAQGPIWGEPARWSVSGNPILEIGELEGSPEYLFSRIRGVVGLAGGTLVVSDGGSSTLRWYDDSGSYLFERGGDGEGPGEFKWVGPIVRSGGDTLVITDLSLRRISEFSATGDLVRTVPVEGVTVPGEAHRLSDGTFLVGSSGFSSTQLTGEEEGLGRALEPIVRIGNGLEAPDTVGTFPGPEMYFSGRGFGFHPFSRGFYYAVKEDLLFVAAAEGFVVDAFAPDGQLVRSLRAPDVDLRLTPELIDAYKRRVRDAAAEQPPASAERALSELEDMYFPDIRPAYARLVAGDEALWLEEHTAGPPSGARRWAVFGHDGDFRGIAELPAGFRLSDVRGDRVFGTWTDDLGVEYVRVHRLEATEP